VDLLGEQTPAQPAAVQRERGVHRARSARTGSEGTEVLHLDAQPRPELGQEASGTKMVVLVDHVTVGLDEELSAAVDVAGQVGGSGLLGTHHESSRDPT